MKLVYFQPPKTFCIFKVFSPRLEKPVRISASVALVYAPITRFFSPRSEKERGLTCEPMEIRT